MLPRLDVGVHHVVDGRILGKVDGLGDRAADERLDRAHHLDVSHVVDRAHAVLWLERAVEHREVLVLELGRALDRSLRFDERGDGVGLRLGVAETAQG